MQSLMRVCGVRGRWAPPADGDELSPRGPRSTPASGTNRTNPNRARDAAQRTRGVRSRDRSIPHPLGTSHASRHSPASRPLRASVATTAAASGSCGFHQAGRYSPALLLTGAGVAGLATIALLALLTSLLASSPRSPAAQVESLGSRVTARALEPPKSGVLSANADPLGSRSDAPVTNNERTLAVRPHHARAARTRARPARTPSDSRNPASKGNQSMVVASTPPATSAASTHNAAPETQSPVITTSARSPASTSTPSTIHQHRSSHLELGSDHPQTSLRGAGPSRPWFIARFLTPSERERRDPRPQAPSSKPHPLRHLWGRAHARNQRRLRVRREQDEDDHRVRRQGHGSATSQDARTVQARTDSR